MVSLSLIVGEVLGFSAFAGALGALLVPSLRKFTLPKFQETYLSDFLPFSHMLEDNKTLVCKDGTLVRIIELKGVCSQTSTPEEREFQTSRKKAWFDAMAERGAAFRLITRRVQIQTHDEATFENPCLQRIHDAWQDQFEACWELKNYLILHSKKRSDLEEKSMITLDHLSEFKPSVLINEEPAEGGRITSPLLTFLGSLINPSSPNIFPALSSLSESLAFPQVLFLTQEGLIEIRDGTQASFYTVLSLRDWGESASEQILMELFHQPFEFEILHQFKGFKKLEASTILRYRLRQENLLFQNVFKNEEFDTALENLEAGNTTLYEHQLTLFIKGSTKEQAQANLGEARKILLNYGLRPVQEFDTIEWLWFSRFPTFDEKTRPRTLFSNNLAVFMMFENTPLGGLTCDWGRGPLRYFKTSSGNGYALQVHVSARKEALAHSLTIAPSESGKTTLFQHLVGGALRHKDLRAYIFDRFQGTRIFTEAAGGSYIDLSSKSLFLNPLQCEDTEENRAFLTQFLLRLGNCGDDASLQMAGRAVEMLFKTPFDARRLESIYAAAFDTNSDLRRGLKKWVERPLSHILNGPKDSLDFSASRLMTFEMTELQRNPLVAASLTEYILHRIRSQVRLEAAPHMIFIDEAAPMLEDPLFRSHVQILLREHRKLRGSINLCFQDAGALFKSGIGETLLNQCQTVFLFQNVNAKQQDYAPLNLTPSEWAFIKGVSQLSKHIKRGVLVKKGRESVILNVDMTGLGNLLNLYKSGSEPLKLMLELKEKFQGGGQWVEHFIDSF